jgi:hypothetical protein
MYHQDIPISANRMILDATSVILKAPSGLVFRRNDFV